MVQRSSTATQMKTTRVQNLFVSQDEIDRCAKKIWFGRTPCLSVGLRSADENTGATLRLV